MLVDFASGRRDETGSDAGGEDQVLAAVKADDEGVASIGAAGVAADLARSATL